MCLILKQSNKWQTVRLFACTWLLMYAHLVLLHQWNKYISKLQHHLAWHASPPIAPSLTPTSLSLLLGSPSHPTRSPMASSPMLPVRNNFSWQHSYLAAAMLINAHQCVPCSRVSSWEYLWGSAARCRWHWGAHTRPSRVLCARCMDVHKYSIMCRVQRNGDW